MRRGIWVLAVLTLVLTAAVTTTAFAKHKKDTESPRLVKPAATAEGRTLEGKADGKTPAENGYWLNTKTGKRHNKNCRYYGKGKNGRACGPNEGHPCGVCGG